MRVVVRDGMESERGEQGRERHIEEFELVVGLAHPDVRGRVGLAHFQRLCCADRTHHATTSATVVDLLSPRLARTLAMEDNATALS